MLLEFLASALPILWPVARFAMLGALVCVPLALFRRMRGFVAVVLFAASIVLGLATWVWGLVVTWLLWNGWAALFGLFILGVGVVPMGMVAAALHAEWTLVWNMGVTLAVLFAIRVFSRWLAEHSG